MKFKGFVQKRIFKNKENNYSIYSVVLENGEEHIITGSLPDLSSDFLYEFEVEENIHPRYGLQYKVLTFKQITSQTEEGLINYLSSDLFFGIGPAKGRRIVKHLGLNAIEKILADKNVLREIGFNPLQTERLYRELYSNQKLESILVTLFSYGLTTNLSMKLFDYYGFETVNILTENPYQLIDDIEGINFKRVDEIAFKLGFKEDNPKRIEAAILFALNQSINSSGNTYLFKEEFYRAIIRLLQNYQLQEIVEETIVKLSEANKIIFKNNTYTLMTIDNIERNLSENLLSFTNYTPAQTNLLKLIEQTENILQITYTELQKEAIIASIENPLTIITGGPGTGKTTVLSGLITTYALLHGYNLASESIVEKIAICAPTGRAARRMTEIMDIPAFTIHKLLGYDYEGNFTFDEENKLSQELFIIDEASMIDIYLAEQLFKSIPNHAKIVIVGDKDQLPSVGPGQVLGDLIEADKMPIILLDEIYRQAANSGIIALANSINNQTVDSFEYNSQEDLLFVKEEEQKIINYLIESITAAIKNGYDLIEDIQILIPRYKGAVGIDAVNQTFQNHFINNKTPVMEIGTRKFYIDDKVMHLVNSPDKGVMNGDIGIVKTIYQTEDKTKVMHVKYPDADVVYQTHELDELTLAYAISIHKSQGSEYKIVYLPLVKGYSVMLRKELLYTGVTRAKQYLYLIGDLSLIEKASKLLNEKRRTRLKEYLTSTEEIEPKKELSPYDFL